MQCHPDSDIAPAEAGDARPFVPSWPGSERHAGVRAMLSATRDPQTGLIDLGVRGSLRRADAAKLLELAAYGHGDVLDIGCGFGLSTVVLAEGLQDRPRPCRLVAIDIDERKVEWTRRSLKEQRLDRNVDVLHGGANAMLSAFAEQGRKFGLVFVDHSTAYGEVLVVCARLATVLEPGAAVVFHDYNDRRSREPDDSPRAYRVYQAVRDGLDPARFAFCSVVGGCGVYRFAG